MVCRRAGLEEQLGALEVAVLARDAQRRGALLLGLVDRCASSEKQPSDLEVAILARDEQRRGALVLGLADRRERAQKELAVTRCRAVVVLWRLCTWAKSGCNRAARW